MEVVELSFIVLKNNLGLLAEQPQPPDKAAMRGLGMRLRGRARELGLADADVAERLGLSQQRYHAYVSDKAEPDLETLVRIRDALGLTLDAMLGVASPRPEDEAELLRARVRAAMSTMAISTMRATAAVVDALAREHVPDLARSPGQAGRTPRRRPG